MEEPNIRSIVSENSYFASNVNQDIEALISAENRIDGLFNNNNRQASAVTQDIDTFKYFPSSDF